MNKTTRLKKPQIPELDTLYEFDDLGGRPKYGGVEMTSETDIPSFQEIMDETHSAVVAEATARDDADEALEAEIQELAGQTSEALEDEAETRAAADTALREAVNSEASTRGAADNVLQNQIDAIVASSDVKDIVGTKAELDAYDKSTLGDNDIIKVLQDESQSNATTYYRYTEATDSFTLIGAEGPYYTKGQADALLNNKADKATTYTKTEVDATVSGLEADIAAKQDQLTAGENITIENNVISAQAGVEEINVSDPRFTNSAQSLMVNLGAGVFKIHNDTQNDVTLTAGSSGSDLVRRTGIIRAGADVLAIIGDTDDSFHRDMLLVGAYTDSGNSMILHYNQQSGGGYPLVHIRDSLTVTNNWADVLSARQGKVLKDMIGDLTNLSTTDKTNLVAAINELVAAAPADFTGTDGTTAGTHGLVPAPATTDAGKFLKADGTWDDAGSPINVVQTTGTSTTDVMSQNATSTMIYKSPALTDSAIVVGKGATMSSSFAQGNNMIIGNNGTISGNNGNGFYNMAIGYGTNPIRSGSERGSGLNNIAIGSLAGCYHTPGQAHVNDQGQLSIGLGAATKDQGSTAIGASSYSETCGEVAFGPTNTAYGYNNSNYRLLTGLYDPQADHDAATKGYVDTAIAAAGGAEEISAADWSNLWQ